MYRIQIWCDKVGIVFLTFIPARSQKWRDIRLSTSKIWDEHFVATNAYIATDLYIIVTGIVMISLITRVLRSLQAFS